MSQTQNSTKKEKEYKPRYARTAEEFIFHTDTDSSNYPIYMLPSFEIIYKRKPLSKEAEDEKVAVFHVKSVSEKEAKQEDLDKFKDQLEKFEFTKALNALSELGLKPAIYIVQITYEIYKGDYEELLGEFTAYAIKIFRTIREEKFEISKQGWAIGHSYMKRFLARIPQLASYTYLKTERPHRKLERLSLIVKLPIATPEFANVFNNMVNYLQGAEEVEEVEEKEEEHTEEVEKEEVKEIPIPEIKPRELEIELAPAPVAVTTAVSTTETRVETRVAPPRQQLVKVYLLSMRLPSKYLVQKVEVNESEEIRKWEGIARDVASRLEGIRRNAYKLISRAFAFVEEFGTWIAVSEEAVEETKKVSEWIREELSKLPLQQIKTNADINKLYSVKAIPIYLEPDDAKALLDAAVQHLSQDVGELRQRIEEAEKEQKKSALKQLQQDLMYKQKLLETFKKYLDTLNM